MEAIFLTIDSIIVVGLLLLAFASLYKKGYKNSVNRLFAFFSLFVGLWISSNHLSNNITMPMNVALISNYVVFASSFGVSIILMQFIAKLVNVEKLDLIIKKSLIPLWAVCAIGASPLVVADIEIQNNIYAISFGPLLWLYGLGISFTIFMIGLGFYYGLKYSTGIARRRLITIGIALVVAIPLVATLSFVIPVITGDFFVTEFGITPLIILVVSLYYGVARLQLFDIRAAAFRTFAYVLSLMTLSAIYYAMAYLLSIFLFKDNVSTSLSISPINISLALLLAFAFQPIKKFFDKITNKFFFKDNYNSDDFYTIVNKTLGSTIDLRGMLERVSTEIAKTLKGDQAFFYINVDENHFITAGTAGHKLLPKSDAKLLDDVEDMKNGVIIASMLEDEDDIKKMMISHRIELILPLNKDRNRIGYLCLGDHLTSSYKNKDITVLNAISNGLIIAIQNALAVQEIREFNETLKQRIANATEELRASNRMLRQLDKAKDEFVGMASHQLRTPLTSVKGYISMVLDGDAGKITASQEQLLSEAFNSSERMVNLINDFLNVSRIQTGKFMIEKTEFDLGSLVEEEINNLKPSIEAHNLKYNFVKPNNPVIVKADKSKISQVAMNFMDNAVYYSSDGTEVNIGIEVGENEVSFTVKDSGIGVPISERSQLFTKFYRASNAKKKRPDGNGVGLYLAKKVIDAHEGKIIFESIEDKGSTFGFSLPTK